MKIKGAIFDMDGTLVDSLMYWGDFWRRFGEGCLGRADFVPDEEVDKRIRTMLYTDALAYIKEYYSVEEGNPAFMQLADGGLADFYRNVAKPKEGAFVLLDHLRREGICMAVASATDRANVEMALSFYGITPYLDGIFSCSDIGVGKDRPDIYRKTADFMGLAPQEICVFEDSYVALETAHKAGFQTVGVFDKYNFAQERLQAASDIYLPEGSTLDSLIAQVSSL